MAPLVARLLKSCSRDSVRPGTNGSCGCCGVVCAVWLWLWLCCCCCCCSTWYGSGCREASWNSAGGFICVPDPGRPAACLIPGDRTSSRVGVARAPAGRQRRMRSRLSLNMSVCCGSRRMHKKATRRSTRTPSPTRLKSVPGLSLPSSGPVSGLGSTETTRRRKRCGIKWRRRRPVWDPSLALSGSVLTPSATVCLCCVLVNAPLLAYIPLHPAVLAIDSLRRRRQKRYPAFRPSHTAHLVPHQTSRRAFLSL